LTGRGGVPICEASKRSAPRACPRAAHAGDQVRRLRRAELSFALVPTISRPPERVAGGLRPRQTNVWAGADGTKRD
jgi:hypothetical protein